MQKSAHKKLLLQTGGKNSYLPTSTIDALYIEKYILLTKKHVEKTIQLSYNHIEKNINTEN